MEKLIKLRDKIRKIIMEYEMMSDKFYMHGEGGDHFPYEDEDKKDKVKIDKDLDKAKAIGMEPVSGSELHRTAANM